jgi:hypothetical protein
MCPETFANRRNMEMHRKNSHKEYGQEKSKGKIPDSNDVFNHMLKAMQKIAADGRNVENKMTQLTKSKQPPKWDGQSFKKFIVEVESWDENNKDNDYNKYIGLLESLKKNPTVKKYIVNVVLEHTKDIETKKVKNVLESLKEKYGKSVTEKVQEVMKEILNFRKEDDESCEVYWDKF